MASATVRISPTAHKQLAELAKTTGATMQEALQRAVESYRRAIMMDQFNSLYQSLRDDPKKWANVLKERELWEQTLLDGLDDATDASDADSVRRKSLKRRARRRKRNG